MFDGNENGVVGDSRYGLFKGAGAGAHGTKRLRFLADSHRRRDVEEEKPRQAERGTKIKKKVKEEEKTWRILNTRLARPSFDNFNHFTHVAL